MPPVLHIAFLELMRRTQEQMLAHQARLRMHHRHHVLQLVAKTKSAAGLVIAAARPQPAGNRLVHQPAVCQYVDGGVGCLDLNRTQRFTPVRIDIGKRIACRIDAAKALDDAADISTATAGDTEDEDDLALLPLGQIERYLNRRTRIETGAQASRQPGSRHGRRAFQGAVAADEFAAIARQGQRRRIDIEKPDALRELGVVGIFGEQGARHRIDFGDDMHAGLRPHVAQHPLDVAGGRHAPRGSAVVAHFQY